MCQLGEVAGVPTLVVMSSWGAPRACGNKVTRGKEYNLRQRENTYT